MSIVIIDYGLSNISSVFNAFKSIYYDVLVSSNHNDLLKAKILVLPGVGTYADGMKNLHDRDLIIIIRKLVLENNIPIIGICLGMQLLSTQGIEGGLTEGLNLIEGNVIKLNVLKEKLRLPHVGWNEIYFENNNDILENIPNNCDVYFIHSYIFDVKNNNHILTKTNYGREFVSSINKNNIYGFQFHPEKSQLAGKILINNIISKYLKI
jgi:glutamine amidotransferase